MTVAESGGYLIRTGLIKLLEIKDSDIRIMTVKQARDAVDKKIHCGGAFSAIIPLVSLFYGGIIRLDIANPTKRGQDMFVLSEGHTVATMASIYADLGYFDRSVLKNSRSVESILNGHPGPLLPGVHAATGPLGQGLGVAEGLALVGKQSPNFDVFCLNGDGELQEGPIWEAVTYSGYKNLDNLCTMVNYNEGQHDDIKELVCPLPNLDKRFECYGWRVFNVDATQYGPVVDALQTFKFAPRDGRPTVIICQTKKGYGVFSNLLSSHNLLVTDTIAEQEIALQEKRRANRVSEFIDFFNEIGRIRGGKTLQSELIRIAKEMNLDFIFKDNKTTDIKPLVVPVKTKPGPKRNKKIEYDASQLPQLDRTKEYSACSVITMAMKAFAQDPRVVSIDADLAKLSGLEEGVRSANIEQALNVGIAEANMMCIGEAFAIMGYNVWVSTIGLFFDWKVMRRIAIGYQERMETMKMKDGWLNDSHGLDLTFVASGPNVELTTGGATHLGNDDSLVFSQIAHLKIIDLSCPNQLLAVMRWVMEGNKGLVYMRIMRSPSGVIYDNDFRFEFGKGYILKESADDKAVIISNGRAVHEALTAANELGQSGIAVGVVDMPSIDEKLLLNLYHSGKLILVTELNNGYIWSEYRRVLCKSKETIDTSRLIPINTCDSNGRLQYIHSATYPQLLNEFGLAPNQLVETIRQKIGSK